MRLKYYSVLNFSGVLIKRGVGSQHNFLKVCGVTIKWPSRQAIILLVKLIFCVFDFCVYHCEGVFCHGEKSNVAKYLITHSTLL